MIFYLLISTIPLLNSCFLLMGHQSFCCNYFLLPLDGCHAPQHQHEEIADFRKTRAIGTVPFWQAIHGVSDACATGTEGPMLEEHQREDFNSGKQQIIARKSSNNQKLIQQHYEVVCFEMEATAGTVIHSWLGCLMSCSFYLCYSNRTCS